LDENADSIHNECEITLANNRLFLLGGCLLKMIVIPNFSRFW